jgi:hypothetical protein
MQFNKERTAGEEVERKTFRQAKSHEAAFTERETRFTSTGRKKND